LATCSPYWEVFAALVLHRLGGWLSRKTERRREAERAVVHEHFVELGGERCSRHAHEDQGDVREEKERVGDERQRDEPGHAADYLAAASGLPDRDGGAPSRGSPGRPSTTPGRVALSLRCATAAGSPRASRACLRRPV